jgi:CRISPR-associated endonuclease/helicase Cas3
MSGMTKAERLTELKRRYIQRAYSDIELAEILETDRSTIFRSRNELSTEYPFIQDRYKRWKIDKTKLVSEIKVNLHEALVLYLATRKTARQTHFRYTHAINAVEKLASVLYQPMTKNLLKTTESLLHQVKDPGWISIIENIAQAWIEQHKLRIDYLAFGADKVKKHIIHPYLIEPSIWSDSVYVIAFSEESEKIIPFKTERVSYSFPLNEAFELPKNFSEEGLLKHAWGVWYQDIDHPILVKLRFNPNAAPRIRESKWHPLEKVADNEDGGCIWQAELATWQEMLPWVRGWGADCEVLEPEDLRDALIRETGLLARLYDVGTIKTQIVAHVRKKDKKIQTLQQHLTNVSMITGEFTKKIDLKEIGEVLGLLHDVGKGSQEFQNYIGSATGIIPEKSEKWVDTSTLKGKIDHSTAGAQIIHKSMQIDYEGTKQALSLCIASHHSGLIDCLTPDGQNSFLKRIEKEENTAHTEESWNKLPEIKNRVEQLLATNLDRQLSIVFDKFEMDKDTIPAQESKEFKYGLLERCLLSCLIDADRLDTADFESPSNYRIRNYGNYHHWDELISRLDQKLKEFKGNADKNEVDELRQEVSQSCFEYSSKQKGIFQLTVPTGGGKTLSSLRFALNHAKAHGMDRIFYIIPYTSIIDQNADEVRKILEDKDVKGNYLNKVVLEHHSNIIDERDEQNGNDEESWLYKKRRSLLSENWDAPIVFTTQVQFLEALFGSGTRGARRMHQLLNSVIIFDEVQTIPVKVVKMFNAALQFLTEAGESSIVLCTATQPLLDKVDPVEQALNIDGKIISDEKKLYEKLKRVKVFDERKTGIGWSEDEIAELVNKELDAKGSVLVIVNTKNSAKSLYDLISLNKDAITYHLSTRMCPVHRLETIDKIKVKLENKEAVICVSTQLIEAGVDIDFGAVIRYHAGLDSIAQAAGRCNRNGRQKNAHGEKTLGHVHIVNPEKENIDRLEDIKEGASITGRVLREFDQAPDKYENDRIGLNAMKQYYQYYFFSRRKIMDYYLPSSSSIGREESLFNLLSLNKTATNRHYKNTNGSIPFFRQSFLTASKEFKAIDSPTRGVIVPYDEKGEKIVSELCSAFELEKQYGLLKEAQRYSINLYSHEFNALYKEGIIQEVQQESGICYLNKQYYSEETGWDDAPVSNMKN